MLLRFCAATLFIFASACVADSSADTQASSELGADHQPPAPPDEAFAACDGLAADDACAFDIDGHHVEGTCRNGPDGNGPLACAPDQPPPPCHMPPPEAFAACDGLATDDACAFDIDGHHVDGTCKAGPDGDGPLACAPDQPPPH